MDLTAALEEIAKLEKEKEEIAEKLKQLEKKEDLLEQSNLLEETNIDLNNTILVLGTILVNRQADWIRPVCCLVLSSDRTKWTQIRFDLPYRIYASGAVCLNDEIYIFGGENNLCPTKALFKLDNDFQWIRLADMNVERSWITNSSLVWNGCIWVLGGKDSHRKCLKSVEKYDPEKDKWTLMPDMKYPRAYAAATIFQDGIQITGGVTDNGITNTAERFEEGYWKELPNRNPLFTHGLVSYKGKMLDISCEGNGFINLEQVDLQISAAQTQQRTFAWTPPDSCAGLEIDKEVYAIGGWNHSNSKVLNGVGIFDGERWRNGPTLPHPIHGKCTLVIPKRLADCLQNCKP